MAKPNVKEQIVTAGMTLFHSKGFNATSVQDITDAAGVPKGSFYNHFASKEELGVEVLQRYADQAGEIGALLGASSLPPRAWLRGYFGKLVESNVASAFDAGCMLGNFSTELSNQSPAIRNQARQSFAAMAKMLEDVIAQGQRDGSIGNAQPAPALANFTADAWQGAVLRAKAEKDRAPLDRFVAMVLDRILV
ncbi:transcriptional regulator, TetR family [Duganella sp. CF517]|uniref:TetR/AcrR family transcriptional regulator n=1 Tax=Duganella sp. CF517 TaxID=1881038 RepID=UPI0008BE7D34|nr:TetR/AcrR family transcriptional regulator [Duganella sp. CF517]SEO54260.1 transcriptional regulator, TetR family [Duganella sp. CF517]